MKTTDDTLVVTLTVGQLKSIIAEVLEGRTPLENRIEQKVFDINEALLYLSHRGVQLTKSSLYRHTMNGTIKFNRFGERKLAFKIEDLEEFIDGMIKPVPSLSYKKI